jgi:hypothetical protein
MQAALGLADFRAFLKFLEMSCCVTPIAMAGGFKAKALNAVDTERERATP